MSEKIWSDEAWDDYLYWQKQDKKTLKPEPLSGDLSGEFSRRIDDKNRLVYHMDENRIYIAHCRGHYGDK